MSSREQMGVLANTNIDRGRYIHVSSGRFSTSWRFPITLPPWPLSKRGWHKPPSHQPLCRSSFDDKDTPERTTCSLLSTATPSLDPPSLLIPRTLTFSLRGYSHLHLAHVVAISGLSWGQDQQLIYLSVKIPCDLWTVCAWSGGGRLRNQNSREEKKMLLGAWKSP